MKMLVVSETCAQPGKQDGGIRVLRTEDRVLGEDQWAKRLKILFWGKCITTLDGWICERGKKTHDFIAVSQRCPQSFDRRQSFGGWLEVR